jgi:hypothetical protein
MASPFAATPPVSFAAQSSRLLRSRLLWALGAPALAVSSGCGDDDTSSKGHVLQELPTHDGQLVATTECGAKKEAKAVCFGHDELRGRARFGKTGPSYVEDEELPPELSASEIDALFLPNGCLPSEYVYAGCTEWPIVEGNPIENGDCCYLYCEPDWVCGRPFLVHEKPRLPELARRHDWSARDKRIERPGLAELSEKLKQRLARAWLEDARMEYASIAAFARFTLELIGFGAPADLVLRSQEAGLDEFRHARACFAMAERFSGESMGPAPMRVHDAGPRESLQESVLCTVVEGCIGETLAAARAQAAADHTTCPETRELLLQIAKDEGRHAELAWRFVAWAVRREPSLRAPVREAFGRSLRELTSEREHADADGLPHEENELARAYGRLPASDEREVARTTAMEVIKPCMAALLETRAEVHSPS